MGPFDSCNEQCRLNLYCKLTRSTQQDVLNCRESGLWDEDYGLNFLMSSFENPWTVKHVVPGA